MTPRNTALIATAMTVVLTAGWLCHERRDDAREADRLREDNERMRLLVSRRHEAWMRQAQRMRGTEYRHAGQATPADALQTFAWAGDRGDLALMGRLIYFDPAARTKAERYFAALPAEVRAHWTSLDAMAAALSVEAVMSRPWPGAAVLQQARFEALGSERVKVILPGTHANLEEFQHTPAGWKHVITEALVDAHIEQEARAAATGSGAQPPR